MCGIWISIIDNLVIQLNDEKIYEKIKERGPDQQNIINHNLFKIAFYRLSINDLSNQGLQPFYEKFDNNQYAMICNGEIYNYKDLMNQFNIRSYTHSDCEIILPLFLCLQKDINKLCNLLDGEFAFVIIEYNTENNNIKGWVARDPYGVRPLFFGYDNDHLIFSSLLKGISGETNTVFQFPPGHYGYFENKKIQRVDRFYHPIIKSEDNNDIQIIYQTVCHKLIQAVKKRLLSDSPIGALLSGGLDSSLLVAIIYKILKIEIPVFCIGLKDCESTDAKYAKKVVDHLDIKNFHLVLIDSETALSSIDDIIYHCETYDITTIRASIMQYHCAKYIRENTNIKTIINGDGADELQMGYLYIKLAPNESKAVEENTKLLEEIHFFDGLRVDRCLGANGLEARLPYLDKEFVEYFLSIPLELRLPFRKLEKELIRKSFHSVYPGLLPDDVLFRKKEAFSDGVSSPEKSWYKIIQQYFDSKKIESKDYVFNPPFSKESQYYRQKFSDLFNIYNKNYDTIIPHFWQPNFTTIKDPSARELHVYDEIS